jgi:hypothetical protein
MSDTSQGVGWWLASDGKWYPPQSVPAPSHQAASTSGNQKVLFRNSHYLGGLPGTKQDAGNLHVSDAGIGVGGAVAKKRIVIWADMASISFDSATAAKSRVGATLAFGLLGALASKGTQDTATITVNLKDGNAAFYRVDGKSGPMVRAGFQPFLIANAVPCLDDHATPYQNPSQGVAPGQSLTAASTPSPLGLADELGKLAGLRDQGVLSDEEFQAMKQQLLDRGSVAGTTATGSANVSQDQPAAPPPPPTQEEDSWRHQLRQEMQAQKDDGTLLLARQVPSPFGPRARKERKERKALEKEQKAQEKNNPG